MNTNSREGQWSSKKGHIIHNICPTISAWLVSNSFYVYIYRTCTIVQAKLLLLFLHFVRFVSQFSLCLSLFYPFVSGCSFFLWTQVNTMIFLLLMLHQLIHMHPFIAYMNCCIAFIPSLLCRVNELLHLCIDAHIYCLVGIVYISFKFGGCMVLLLIIMITIMVGMSWMQLSCALSMKEMCNSK